MIDVLLTGPYVPFTVALALLLGLAVLELLLLLVGGTLLGMDADAHLDVDLDVDMPDVGDLGIDFGDADPGAFETFEPEVEAPGATPAGPAAWLGIGKVPTLIWLAAVLFGFGASGFALQSVVSGVIGGPLPAVAAIVPAAAAGLWFAGRFGKVFAAILPKTETTALSERHLGRRTGTVTQGTAQRGAPAEVRIRDRHGNTHYLRAEPLRDDATIPQGTEVLVLRHRSDAGGYRLVALGDMA